MSKQELLQLLDELDTGNYNVKAMVEKLRKCVVLLIKSELEK